MTADTRPLIWKLGLATFLLVAATGAAQANAGSDKPALEEGFLTAGLEAQTSYKVFDVTGDFTLSGFLGVGLDDPDRAVHLQGRNAVFRMDRDVNTAAFLLVRTALNNFDVVWKTFVVGANADGPNDGSFIINDLGSSLGGGGARRLTIDNDGNFGLNTSTPSATLHIFDNGNPVALGYSNDVSEIFRLEDDGDILVRDGITQLLVTSTTPNGFILTRTSTLLGDTGGGLTEEAWLALNGDNALLMSPGDGTLGLLTIFDQDADGVAHFTFDENQIEIRGSGNKEILAAEQDSDDILLISTAGDEAWFVSDSSGSIVQGEAFRWFANGTTAGDTLMELNSGAGSLHIGGTLMENTAFDLAESFWKADSAIEAGDVVRIDPRDPSAVKLASRAADRAVVGVVSTKPGIVMGGGAFSVKQLTEVWGEEIAARFAEQHEDLYAGAWAKREDLRQRAAQLDSFDAFLKRRFGDDFTKALAKPEDNDRLVAEFETKVRRLADDIVAAEIDLFFERNFARIALAGRVPVKVDAGYGAIEVGDLLVSSPTPGHAQRADNPKQGAVLGKALQPLDRGTGTIMMLVMLR